MPRTDITAAQRARASALRKNLTGSEQRLWRYLKSGQMLGCHFRRQAPIGNYIADFVCHSRHLVIEVDGEHHGRSGQIDHDLKRDAWLASQGYHVLRFTNTQILQESESVSLTIQAALEGRLPGDVYAAIPVDAVCEERAPSLPSPTRGEDGVEVNPPPLVGQDGCRGEPSPLVGQDGCRGEPSPLVGEGREGALPTADPTSTRSAKFGASEGDEGIIRCDACPVLCRIRPGRSGACARYANQDGLLIRTDPVVLLEQALEDGQALVPFNERADDWDGSLLHPARVFVTGIGAGTTYPDYKPAPFIVSQQHEGVDTVTVVTEGIFSYCGVKVKIDTDRHLGSETATIRCEGEPVGHVTTAEYGSQMLSLGGVRHLTGGSKKEGHVTCATLLKLCNGEAVELSIDNGHTVVVQAGKAPVVDGKTESRMRVGCGSATIGIFAQQWLGHVDEVIVLDDHITGVLSEHQAGRVLAMRPSGIRIKGRKSTPGRYFQVANPGLGWGGTDISDPLAIIQRIDPGVAWPGMRLLLTSTTGEDALWCVLDEALRPVPATMPQEVRAVVERIGENCEASLCSVLFMAGAGGSLRAGVSQNPVLLTRSVQDGSTKVTLGGAPAMLWPGGGITVMVDVTRLPRNAFGSVPTPALVAPIEFTLPRALYEASGGHLDEIMAVEDVIKAYGREARVERNDTRNPWPLPG